MDSSNKIAVNKKTAGERLDIFLSKKLKTTRSQVQKMIDKEQILINNKKPKKYGEIVKENDKVICHCKPRCESGRSNPIVKKLTSEIEGIASSSANERTPRNDIKIITETPDYLIVEKPSGMLTHPTEAKEKNTLADWLIKKYPKLKNIGDSPALTQKNKKNVRPGIVHRLDKEASGILVIAKTQKMFEHLKNQFKNRVVKKEYIVLTHGRIIKDWDEIDFQIGRSKTNAKMAATPKTVKKLTSDIGKDAKTEFFVEKRFVNFSLLRIIIHTGRMHQIRVHMFAYNNPVVGDPLYFQKKQKRVWDEKCGRLFLHSAKLGFTDLDGKFVEFESPLPKKLEEFLKKII